jgi:hypothetical protein
MVFSPVPISANLGHAANLYDPGCIPASSPEELDSDSENSDLAIFFAWPRVMTFIVVIVGYCYPTHYQNYFRPRQVDTITGFI